VGSKFEIISLKSDVDDITLSQTDRDTVPGLGVFIKYDDRDSISNPHKGWWNEIEIVKHGDFLGGDGDYWSFDIDLRRFQPIKEKYTLGLFSLTTFQTGKVGAQIPIYKDFHLGGTNTIRGWDLDSSSGKNQMINTAELRYSLFKPRSWSLFGINAYTGMQLALFYDLGITWDDHTEFNVDSFIGGVGIGLRIQVPFVDVIRLDIGIGDSGDNILFHLGVLEKSVQQRRRIR